MAILNDKKIKELDDVITPFIDHQVEKGVLSYGLGSMGYDIRISNKFKLFTNISQTPIDPKDFSKDSFVEKEVDNYVVIPPNSFALGVSREKFNIPDNIMALCVGKSTYARMGLVINLTPAEPGWSGKLVIEASNTTPLPVKLYANEGIAQMMFFKGDRPNKTYADKKGKYQDQGDEITTPKVI